MSRLEESLANTFYLRKFNNACKAERTQSSWFKARKTQLQQKTAHELLVHVRFALIEIEKWRMLKHRVMKRKPACSKTATDRQEKHNSTDISSLELVLFSK